MKVVTLEPLKTSRGVIPSGKIISIPPETAARLKGKVKPVPFDRDRWQRLTRELITGFGDHDPGGGCWQWVQTHQPGLWKRHRDALAAVDLAFHTKDEEAAEQALSHAEQTFLDCLGAWGNRHHLTQPDLESKI